jgi:metal transporter CNNM
LPIATLAPVTWPIARLLDWVLGADTQHTYRKAELKSLLQLHRTGAEPLKEVEVNILSGVLELGSKNVESVMTPLRVSKHARATPLSDAVPLGYLRPKL